MKIIETFEVLWGISLVMVFLLHIHLFAGISPPCVMGFVLA
jgi:hypothetical protein